MKLQKATISNFKGIQACSLEFRPGFNLIKGENGKGKTSILEALAVGLGGYIAGIDGVKARHFTKDEVRRVYSRVGEGSYDVAYMLPTQVTLTVDMEDQNGILSWTRGMASIQAARSTLNPRTIARVAEQTANQKDERLPLLCYQSAARVWSQKRDKTEDLFGNPYFRTIGYMDALFDASSVKLLLNWCLRMEQIAFQKGKKIAEYEAVKQAVSQFMDCIEGRGTHSFFYDKQAESLMYLENGAVLPISDLSAGYQSLIWMVFDLAYRMALLNPALTNHIAETSGIVLIDELDMHLHPRWQWKVIDALRTTFPNVQFIAASHAPILFASAKDVWLIDIEGEEIQYSQSHYGIDISSSVRQFQGRYELPEEIRVLSDQFYSAMDRENYAKAKVILDELKEKTAPAFPLVVDMQTMYEIETAWPEA